MRSLPLLLLVSLIMIGCGSPVSNKGSDPSAASVVLVPPSISELSPGTVPVNSVPFAMTVNGSNFGTDATVFWHGVPQHTVFITPSQLMVSVTSDDLQFTGLVPVYVLSAGLTSNTLDFNVTPQ